MTRTNAFLLLAMLLTSALGCDTSEDGFTVEEWNAIRQLTPLPALPPDTTNRYADDPAVARFGQKLFFEKSYSGPILPNGATDGLNGGLGAAGDTGKVSCAVCHAPGTSFQDARSNPPTVSLGTDWLTRNAPTVLNSAFYTFYGWGQNADSYWLLCIAHVEGARNTNSSRLAIAHMLYDKYRDEYNSLFTPPLDPALDKNAVDAARFPPAGKPKANAMAPDGAWEKMTAEDRASTARVMVNFTKAIAAYGRKLVSRSSPFDRYVEGGWEGITPQAKRGLKLFLGVGCTRCHSTPLFSDGQSYATGVPQSGLHVPVTDLGHFDGAAIVLNSPFNSIGAFSDDVNTGRLKGLAQTDDLKGRFRTKGLRDSQKSGPYMHTGGYATLREVVDFYNRGGESAGFPGQKTPLLRPLNLTSAEMDALVAFLETLTSDPLPAALTTDMPTP